MEDKNSFNFINEKVVKKRKSLKERVKNGGFFCVQALAFGVLAAVAFACMEPRADFLINGEEEPVINISNDNFTTEQTASEETTQKEENTTSSTSEHESEKVTTPVDSGRNEQVKQDHIRNSMVVIECKKNAPDSKKSTQLVSVLTCGSVVNVKNSILVLTDYSSVKDSSIITVTFSNSMQCVAEIKKYDEQLDLAVLKVVADDIFPEDYEPEVTSFTSSKGITAGSRVTYAGASEGIGYITSNCEITSSRSNVQFADCVYSMFATNMASNVGQNGFIFNDKGQMIAMVTKVMKDSVPNTVTVFGISELRAVIEKLSNGRTLPYVGVTGITVTDDIINSVDSDMPKGVYVKSVESASPAYSAGILKGDIIVSISGTDISTIEEYSAAINSLNPGNKIEIMVMRKGLSGYKEISYTVTAARKTPAKK